MYNNIDNNKISLLTLCDLSKAFDSVSPSVLMEKLDSMHIDGFWFADYLKDRTQSVKLDGHISERRKVEYGVPQGSILGPLLFNIYVNDLHEIVDDGLLVQYADDSQLLISGDIENLVDIIERCENNIHKVKEYFAKNGLKLNSEKTQFQFFGSRQYIARIPEDLGIQVDTSLIKPCNTIKNLGIIMDQFLSFDNHIRNMCAKANGILYFLHRNKECLDKDSRKMVVESLVNSIFSYCSTIWSGCGKTSLARLQRVQNFASKVATGRGRKYDHATQFINELGWLKVENKVMYDVCVYVFKVLNEEIPNWVTPFQTVGMQRGRQTRQSNDLFIPRKRTNVADKAVSVRGARLWNGLPANIKDINVNTTFKNKKIPYLKQLIS